MEMAFEGGSLLVRGADADAGGRTVSYLNLEADVGSFRQLIGSEPKIGDWALDQPLVRVLRQDPWECLAGFICSQNSNIPRIKQMVAAVTRLGRRLNPDQEAYEFPPPEVVAEAGESYWRSVGLGYRARAIAETAGLVGSAQELSALRSASYREAREYLLGLTGVGPKVADCVMAYSLDKGEAFPVDVHVRRAAVRLYGLDAEMRYDDLGEWARSRFGEYAAWAQLYLFRDEINRRP